MRCRNLKSSFWANEDLAAIEPLGRLLFQGLWCLADREGRLEDRPLRIKAQVLPYDNADVEALLAALTARGFIVRYSARGGRFIQVAKFTRHQKPHPKESASVIPAPDSDLARTDLGAAEATPRSDVASVPAVSGPADVLNADGADVLNAEDGAGGKPPARPRKKAGKGPAVDTRDVTAVFDHWARVMGEQNPDLDDARKRLICRALQKYPVARLLKAIDGCGLSAWHQGKNQEGVRHNGLKVILKDAEQIEKFIGLAERPPAPAPPRGNGVHLGEQAYGAGWGSHA